MSQALRKLAGTINRSGGIAVFINQLREKIGVTYGSPEVTTGGRALKFFSSVRIDIRKKEVIKSGSTPIGNRTKVKIAKNKVAPPFKEVEFDLIFGEGICPASEVIEFGEILGIIKKSGSWYSYNGERVGQGKESVKTMLKENPDAAVAIRKEILERKDEIFVIKKAKSKKDGKNKGKNNDADVDFEEEDIDEAAEEFEDEED
jgi:recombination protein RecA